MSEILFSLMNECAAKVKKFIERQYSNPDKDYEVIVRAQTYSLLAGGKRIRPFLVLKFAELFGGDEDKALPLAGAIEMIHTFSLIHDDLPCMDNDVLRRGKNTCHVEFDESTALLAGDALSIAAFEVIAKSSLSDKDKVRATLLLSENSGYNGMIAGQIIDLSGEKEKLSYDMLLKLHSLKTGCLIRCAAALGCVAAGVSENDEKYHAAIEYSEKIGLAFQIIDDILDKTGDEAILGKSIGKDENSRKTTFLSYMSIEEATKTAERLTNEAIDAIKRFDGSDTLVLLAEYLLKRQN